MRFIGVLILVVGCGRNGASADERKKGAAREEDKLRRAGMAASVTTRGVTLRPWFSKTSSSGAPTRARMSWLRKWRAASHPIPTISTRQIS